MSAVSYVRIREANPFGFPTAPRRLRVVSFVYPDIVERNFSASLVFIDYFRVSSLRLDKFRQKFVVRRFKLEFLAFEKLSVIIEPVNLDNGFSPAFRYALARYGISVAVKEGNYLRFRLFTARKNKLAAREHFGFRAVIIGDSFVGNALEIFDIRNAARFAAVNAVDITIGFTFRNRYRVSHGYRALRRDISYPHVRPVGKPFAVFKVNIRTCLRGDYIARRAVIRYRYSRPRAFGIFRTHTETDIVRRRGADIRFRKRSHRERRSVIFSHDMRGSFSVVINLVAEREI